MAQRTISTRIAIEGEQAYKNSIANINSSLRALKAGLAEVESRYAGSANSVAALSAKNSALAKVVDAQAQKTDQLSAALNNARSALQAYTQKADALRTKLDANAAALSEMSAETRSAGEQWATYAKAVSDGEARLVRLQKSTADTADEQAALREKIQAAREAMQRLEDSTGGAARVAGELTQESASLNAEMANNARYVESAQRGVNAWSERLSRAQVESREFGDALAENERYLAEAQRSFRGCARSIDANGRALSTSQQGLETLAATLAASKIPAALSKIRDALRACVDASVEFESAMAGVAKTTDLTDDELAAMGEQFKQMSTEMPATATELAGIAETAGQLGIKKDNIAAFARVMADLGVATDLTADEAATLLARFANVTGMAPGLYENLGSVVVALGNNFATTESEIVAMGQRLASAGELAGLSEAEIMALAAAMSSVGIEAEAGGTAMTQTLSAIEKAVASGSDSVDEFARVAGMSASEFADKWRSTPIEALQAFISGLGRLDAEGESATVVLDNLGMSGVRQSNMLKSLGLASDVLTGAVNTANKAWAENNALTKEASTRYATTESQFQMFKNAVTNLQAAVGDQLTPALSGLADAGTDVVSWAKDFVEEHEALIPLVTALVAGLAAFSAAATISAISTTALATALKAATAAAAANPFILAATAVVALGTAVYTLVSNAREASPAVADLTEKAHGLDDAIAEANASFDAQQTSIDGASLLADQYIDRLAALEEAGLSTAAAQSEYRITLDLLRELVPDLNVQLDAQTGIIEGGAAALRDQVAAWKETAIQQALMAKYQGQIDAYGEAMLEAAENQARLTQVESEAAVVQAQIDAATERITNALERQKKISDDHTMSVEEKTSAMDALNAEINDAQSELMGLQEQLVESGKAQSTYRAAVDECTEAAEANKAEVDGAEQAMREFADAQDGASSALGGASDALAGSTDALEDNASAADELAEAYQRSFESAYSSIQSQIGVLGDLTEAASEDIPTVSGMIEQWAGNAAALADQVANLQYASELGISQGLLLQLAEATPEAAALLQNIVDELKRAEDGESSLGDTARQVRDAINESYGSMDFNEQGLASARAGLENGILATGETIQSMAGDVEASGQAMTGSAESVVTDITTLMQDGGEKSSKAFTGSFDAVKAETRGILISLRRIVSAGTSTLPASMWQVGQQMVTGMISGINSRAGALSATVQAVVSDAVASARAAADTNSPSRKTKKIFADVGEGMIVGIESRRTAVAEAMRSVVDAALAFESSGRDVADRIRNIDAAPPALLYADDARALPAPGTDAVERRLDRLADRLDRMTDVIGKMQVVLDTGAVVGGIADSVDADLGRRQIIAGRYSL